MATPSIHVHSSVAVEQEAFAQRKLEELYRKTCERLRPYRNLIELAQEVFVWRKPAASLALYGAIHWMFIYFVRWNGSLLTGLSSLLFWLLLGDILWRAATRDGGSGGQGQQQESRAHSQRRSISREMSFDTVLVQASTPIGSQQLAPFEIICLRVSRGLMWGDNLRLALQHWSTSEPFIFSVMIAIPGVILSLLGKYIPTIVLAYVVVMGVVVWPYIEYHNLRSRALQFILTRFPAAVQQAKSVWAFIKTVAVSRDDGDHPEFSLRVGDDEDTTQQTLQHAFDQATAQPKEGEGGGDRHGGARTRDPGLSLLQDSVLGLNPNAFHNADLDSLSTSSLGPGEFPSITNFDRSGSVLPHFSQEANQPMPTIQEEEGPQDDLDPYMDSVEVEFGRFEFPDGRTARRSKLQHPLAAARRNPRSYGLSSSSSTNPSTHDPYAPSAPPLVENFDRRTPPLVENFDRRTPPPRYEDIVPNAGMYSPDDGPEQPWFDTQYMPPRPSPLYEQTVAGAGGMVPRSSSTPLVEGNPAGLRYREVHKP